jgi:hypothetical protein
MPIKSASEWAELYQAAIESIVAGTVSSYSISGRSFTKHDLGTLEDLYRYWLGKAAEQSHGFTTQADMRGPQ